jgi:hypothetical protein
MKTAPGAAKAVVAVLTARSVVWRLNFMLYGKFGLSRSKSGWKFEYDSGEGKYLFCENVGRVEKIIVPKAAFILFMMVANDTNR